MLVKNNLPTVLDFGSFPNGTKLHGPGTENHGFKIPGIQLLPGMNEVDAAAWAMWTGEGRAASKGANGAPAGLDWHILVKNVEVVKVEVEEADEKGHSIVKTVGADEFADLSANDAIALVNQTGYGLTSGLETFVAAMLNKWGEAEDEGKHRATVFAALREQLDLLQKEALSAEDPADG